MSAAPVQANAPARVTLAVGPEELLADRAVGAVVRAVRDLDPEADVRALDAVGLSAGEITALLSPSLFGERKVIVVRNVAQARDEVLAELKDYVSQPMDDVALVLVHKGGVKGKAVLEAARKAKAIDVSCAEVKTRRDRVGFVTGEFRAARRQADDDAVQALLDSVGGDLRSLASACAQLVADTTGTIDLEVVRVYYEGRADVTGFAVADAAVEGRAVEALTQLRWALGSGTEPVLIVSALAAALRSIVKVAAAPRGIRPADLARELGMPPWKVERVLRQRRGWDPEAISAAVRAVAEADAHIKGAGGDPLYALERVVVTVARAHTGA